MLTQQRQQPARGPEDGPVVVRWIGDLLEIEATGAGGTESVIMSQYNAFRIFGMMAMALGIKLPASVAKGIKL